MFGIIPNQGIGIHAFLPVRQTSGVSYATVHTLPEGHVFKENKLKMAKHPNPAIRYSQVSVADMPKKVPGSIVEKSVDPHFAYCRSFRKKRKAEDADLIMHEDSTAPQLQCRYVPSSPFAVSNEVANKTGFRTAVFPSKQVHYLNAGDAELILTGVSNAPVNGRHNSVQAATNSKASVKNSTTQGDYMIVVGEVLRSSNESYEVLAFLGRGTFGQVVKCRCNSSKRHVAIKILKNLPSYLRQGNVEIQILQTLSQQDTESHNIVRAIECFQHKNHMCFVFELLEQNLYEYLKSNKFRPLSLPEIRPIAQQVLTALSKLKALGLIHADLKPENIMLVCSSTGAMRYRVKVIDFGSACHSSKAVQNTYLQSRYYRAPEILLGLPFNEAIDMWSLGCVLAELFLGWPLYPGSSEYDQMRYIVDTQGLPPHDLLQSAAKCSTFFVRGPYQCDWRLKTQEEYALETGQQAKEARKYFFSSLSQICDVSGLPPPDDPDREFELEDRQQFALLLQLMLRMRPSDRVVPDSARLHPFITMLHLQGYSFSKRFHESITLMQVCNEATRRKQLLTTRNIAQQSFGSLPSIHEHYSNDLIISSVLPSPAVSNSTATTSFILQKHSSTSHTTDTAVAYYAAAAVAALAKPTLQLTASSERKQLSNCSRRTYKGPDPSSTSIHHSTAPSLTNLQRNVGHPEQSSEPEYTNSTDGRPFLKCDRVAVPHSLSLYDLVTAGGNALSLLNTVAAPTSSDPTSTTASRTQSHASPSLDSFYRLHRQSSFEEAVAYNRAESDDYVTADQSEQAVLMLSSYLGQEQHPPQRSGSSTSSTLGNAEFREKLNALVEQRQQQHQQQLCRDSVAFLAVQQQQQQNLMNRYPQALIIGPPIDDLGTTTVFPVTTTGLLSHSLHNLQNRIHSQQTLQRQLIHVQQVPATGVLTNQLVHDNQHFGGKVYHQPSNLVKPIHTNAIPLLNAAQMCVQELPNNYSILLQQPRSQNTVQPTQTIRISCARTTPSNHLSGQIGNTALVIPSHANPMPVNLVTGTESNGTVFPGEYVDSTSAHPQSKWMTDSKSVTLTGIQSASGLIITGSKSLGPGNMKLAFSGKSDDPYAFQSLEVTAPGTPSVVRNDTITSSDSESFATALVKTEATSIGDCKPILVDGSLSSISSASHLRSDKKIPVGRVQPMIKQEEASSTSSYGSARFPSSPTSTLGTTAVIHNAVAPSVHVDVVTTTQSQPHFHIPSHCIPHSVYQPLSPETRHCSMSNRSTTRRQPPPPAAHVAFQHSDPQSARHLSAAHAAAAAYHNLMYFQLQQQQQQQQQLHESHVPAFPTVSAIHLRPAHYCATQSAPVRLPVVPDTWASVAATAAAAVAASELQDPRAAAAAASYYAAAAELELLFNHHSAHLRPNAP